MLSQIKIYELVLGKTGINPNEIIFDDVVGIYFLKN